jgi:adiponectin receptor
LVIATPEEVGIFLSPIIMSRLCVFIGVIFFLSRIPERHAPGRFDLFLNSHQIWHVLIFLGLQSAIEGMKRLHKLRSSQIY